MMLNRFFKIMLIVITLFSLSDAHAFAKPVDDLLVSSVRSYDIKLVKQAITKGANVNQLDKDGETPLINLVHRSDKSNANAVKIAKILVNAGADRMIGNKEGKTALQYAAEKKWDSMIAILLPLLPCCR